jgi:hypothetical protein
MAPLLLVAPEFLDQRAARVVAEPQVEPGKAAETGDVAQVVAAEVQRKTGFYRALAAMVATGTSVWCVYESLFV